MTFLGSKLNNIVTKWGLSALDGLETTYTPAFQLSTPHQIISARLCGLFLCMCIQVMFKFVFLHAPGISFFLSIPAEYSSSSAIWNSEVCRQFTDTTAMPGLPISSFQRIKPVNISCMFFVSRITLICSMLFNIWKELPLIFSTFWSKVISGTMYSVVTF